MIVSWEIKSKQRTKSQIVNLFIDIGKKRKKLLSTIRERRLAHCHFFFFFGTVSLSSTIHFEVTLSFRFNCPFFSNIFYRTFVDDINALRSPASNSSLFFFFFLRSGNNLNDEYGHQIERKIPQYRWRCENVSRRGAHILIGRRN